MKVLCDGTLVFTSPGTLDEGTARAIAARLEREFPGHRVVVLERGCELVCLPGEGNDEQVGVPAEDLLLGRGGGE